MMNDRDNTKLFYEQSTSLYSNEANLVFGRLNFFLTSMSFLVAAMVLILAEWKSGDAKSFTYFSVVILGFWLSFVFFLVELAMTKQLKVLRDHTWKLGEELGDEAPLNILRNIDPDNQRFNEYVKEIEKHIHCKCLKPSVRRFLEFYRDYPAFHLWLISFFFLVFWEVMVCVYLVQVWDWGLVWWCLMASPVILGVLPGLIIVCVYNKLDIGVEDMSTDNINMAWVQTAKELTKTALDKMSPNEIKPDTAALIYEKIYKVIRSTYSEK